MLSHKPFKQLLTKTLNMGSLIKVVGNEPLYMFALRKADRYAQTLHVNISIAA